MTQLRLTLRQPYANGWLEDGAVASVRLLTDTKGAKVERWWSCEKPVSISGDDDAGNRETVFELPMGGTYGVQITRPRGLDISREVRISNGKSHAETISLEVSPHEHLSWLQYAGIVRARRENIAALSSSSVVKRKPRAFTKLPGVRGLMAFSDSQDVSKKPSTFAAALPASRDAWSLIGDATRNHIQEWTKASPWSNRISSCEDAYTTWRLDSPPPEEGRDLIEGLRAEKHLSTRMLKKYPRWITFEFAGRRNLVSVPWPWWGARGADDERKGAIRIICDCAGAIAVDQAASHFSVSVLDKRWFGLLEFLASGRLIRTGAMFDDIFEREQSEKLFDADDALYGKVKGPLVATAGAIILIARANSTQTQKWDAWVENLSRWFPGIPDGAILLGCRRVDQARNLEDIRAAYGLLAEGASRGIPFFAATILMLSLRLSQIANDVPEADELRRLITPVSTRIDPEQVFTVIRL